MSTSRHKRVPRLVPAVWLCLLLAGGTAQAQVPDQEHDLGAGDRVIQILGGLLFDSVDDSVRSNSGLLIRNGIILAVDAELGDAPRAGVTVITLQDDETILPGLFDLHGRSCCPSRSTSITKRRSSWPAAGRCRSGPMSTTSSTSTPSRRRSRRGPAPS